MLCARKSFFHRSGELREEQTYSPSLSPANTYRQYPQYTLQKWERVVPGKVRSPWRTEGSQSTSGKWPGGHGGVNQDSGVLPAFWQGGPFPSPLFLLVTNPLQPISGLRTGIVSAGIWQAGLCITGEERTPTSAVAQGLHQSGDLSWTQRVLIQHPGGVLSSSTCRGRQCIFLRLTPKERHSYFAKLANYSFSVGPVSDVTSKTCCSHVSQNMKEQ